MPDSAEGRVMIVVLVRRVRDMPFFAHLGARMVDGAGVAIWLCSTRASKPPLSVHFAGPRFPPLVLLECAFFKHPLLVPRLNAHCAFLLLPVP